MTMRRGAHGAGWRVEKTEQIKHHRPYTPPHPLNHIRQESAASLPGMSSTQPVAFVPPFGPKLCSWPSSWQGFGESELGMLEDSELDTKAREKEIMHVADSIRDLQTIFKELAVLVIDQGTIIDRIDYNIEKVR